jgi:subtilase family serine protease
MTLNRGWWVAFVLAPVAMFTEGSAHAADPALPHGVHRMANGRYMQDLCDHDQRFYCMAHRVLPESYRPGDDIEEVLRQHPLATGQGLAPSDIISGYSLSGSAGGKMVAVLDENDGSAFTDMNTYRTTYGIPTLPQCTSLPNTSGTPCFASVDESGGSLNQNLGSSGQADGETTLDVQMISAACPDCSILLVQFTQPSDQDFITSAATAKAKGAVACSISWGGGEGQDPTGYSSAGFIVTAAAGDSGYQGGSYPASSPDVIGVGGTTYSAPGQEVVWNDGSGQGSTGSGCSTEFPMPAYQTAYGASKFSGCSMRDMNDVSAAAESTVNGGGIANVTGGQWEVVVGTSAASPMVAAIFTRFGLVDAISANFGFIYTNASAFHDITSGNNGSCGSIQCTAGPGWDGPSGIGTPNGSVLATLGTSSSSSSSSGSSSGSTSSSSGSSSGSTGSSSGSSSGGSSSGGASSGGGSGSSGSSSSSGGGGSSSGIGSSSGGSGSSSGAVISPDAGTSNNGADPTEDGFAQLDAPAGCGCTTVGASAGLDGLALLALGGAATVLVRRRRR